MRSRVPAIAIVSVVSMLAVACTAETTKSGSSLDDVTELVCKPKESKACTCPSGGEGKKACNDLGTKMNACKCDDGPSTIPTNPAGASAPVNDDASDPPPPPPKPLPNPSACGNGKLDSGEACDDGNTKNGDGCSEQCQPDGAPAIAERCTIGTDKNAGGQPVALWKDVKVHLVGSTEGYQSDHFTKNVTDTFNDRLYAITPQADGQMQITITFDAGFDGLASLRQTECWSLNNEVWETPLHAKTYASAPMQVTKGQRLWLIMDASSPTPGRYQVDIELH